MVSQMAPREGRYPAIICNRAGWLRSTAVQHLQVAVKREKNYLLFETRRNVKTQRYCTYITLCQGHNWARVWNWIRHASLMGRPWKNALYREGGWEGGGHNPLTRISHHRKSLNAALKTLLAKQNGRKKSARTGSLNRTDWLMGPIYDALCIQKGFTNYLQC